MEKTALAFLAFLNLQHFLLIPNDKLSFSLPTVIGVIVGGWIGYQPIKRFVDLEYGASQKALPDDNACGEFNFTNDLKNDDHGEFLEEVKILYSQEKNNKFLNLMSSPEVTNKWTGKTQFTLNHLDKSVFVFWQRHSIGHIGGTFKMKNGKEVFDPEIIQYKSETEPRTTRQVMALAGSIILGSYVGYRLTRNIGSFF